MGVNVQSVTRRMLSTSGGKPPGRKSTSADRVRSYLAAFGVTDVSPPLALPPVFNAKYRPEWTAFLREYQYQFPKDAPRSALYVILEFMRYMKHMGINPFSRTPKLGGARISPISTYESLISASLEDSAMALVPVIRSSHLLEHTVAHNLKVAVTGPHSGAYTLRLNLQLKPRRTKESLDSILGHLQGFLFDGTALPPQLARKYVRKATTSTKPPREVTPKWGTLYAETSYLGWFALSKTGTSQVNLKRAKDSLVLRVDVHLTLDVHLGHSTKAVLLKLWKAVAVSAFK